MPKYTEYLNIAVQPELKRAIDEEAARQGRTLSAMARHTLERVYLADQVTVEQCAAAKLTDSRVCYHAPVPSEGRVLVDPSDGGRLMAALEKYDTEAPRFVPPCTCRIAATAEGQNYIGGEDDCPVHGFMPEDGG